MSGKSTIVLELQSLRGVAALVVLLHHALRSIDTSGPIPFIAEAILNAQAAVVLFFVLSGFVLTAALTSRPMTRGSLTAFYIRRLLRIFPAIWVACTLVLLYLFTLGDSPLPRASAWLQSYFEPSGFTLFAVVGSYLSISMYLLPTLWTMFVELVASAIMPLFAAISRYRGWALAVTIVALSILSFLVQNGTRLVSIYLVCFAIGAAAPYLKHFVERRVAASPLRETLSLVVAIIVLVWFREVPFDWKPHDPGLIQVEALAAVWLVAVAAYGGGLLRWLRAPALVTLGDLSYSLYLLHFPIIFFVVALGEQVVPAGVDTSILALGVMAIVTALTLLASAATHRFVELPGMALGKALGRKVESLLDSRSADTTPSGSTQVP